MSLLSLLSCAVLLAASGQSRMIKDLTHTFDKDATKWPLSGFGVTMADYFKMSQLAADYSGDIWVAFNYIEFYEHLGTHMDAPNHFGRGRQAMHEIPPERLIGPGVVIDITEKAAIDPDYRVTVQDLNDYETTFGRIPPNAIVMMNSGWGKYFPNPVLVFGSQQTNDSSTFHFPGWSYEAAKMLLTERQVSVVGVDTPSTDHGPSPDFPCHVYLQNNNVPLLEYVANLDSIPQNGTTIFLGSIKSRDGTGGHTRILAVIDDDKGCDTTVLSGANSLIVSELVLSLLTLVWRL